MNRPKPQFYAVVFPLLQECARREGYNLVLHGSMNRDLDLIAIPWVDNPSPEMSLIRALHKILCGYTDDAWGKELFLHSFLPGGRSNYIINLNRGGEWNEFIDEQCYLDISITPLLVRDS